MYWHLVCTHPSDPSLTCNLKRFCVNNNVSEKPGQMAYITPCKVHNSKHVSKEQKMACSTIETVALS